MDQYSLSSDDQITAENASAELIQQVLDQAFIDSEVDDEGDVVVTDGPRTYISVT